MGNPSAFAVAHWDFQQQIHEGKLPSHEYSKFVEKIMRAFASSTSIEGGAALIRENLRRQRFKLMFNFTVAAVNRLSEDHLRSIRDVLNGKGGMMIPSQGVYPKIDAFWRKSPIRYTVMWLLCSLKLAAAELFGAYEMYHFRRDFRSRDGSVRIEEPGGSSFYNQLDNIFCGVFGFQGYSPSGEEDPYMKPNIHAPLFGVEPGSNIHVDYLLNVRGEYDEALIAVFGREFCANFFDPMRPVRDAWPKIAKQMQSMGDEDHEVYPETDDDDYFRNISSSWDDNIDELELDEEVDCDASEWFDDKDFDCDDDDDDDDSDDANVYNDDDLDIDSVLDVNADIDDAGGGDLA